ncbi:MAG: hypothetical protein IRZ07_24570 [Microbispora sp.]|nr:hypothetical protein [Microbispora sp.]PZN25592.1 MAG: hypothetical protein DIU75_00065 [Mycolicibacterium hassiacum]
MSTKRRHTLARYRNEAVKAPFELDLDDGRTITIPQPTVDEVLEITGLTDVRAQLKILAKDQFDELLTAIGDLPASALQVLMEDLMQHFGLGK